MKITRLIQICEAINLPFISYNDKNTAYLLSMDALGTLQACVRRNGRAGMFEVVERVDVNEEVSSYTDDSHFNSVETDIATPCSSIQRRQTKKKKKR